MPKHGWSAPKHRGRPLLLTKKLRIPQTNHEEYLKTLGFKNIAGIDEVGRGAWAGPLVAAAVILPPKKWYKIRDSKLLNSKERTKLAQKIIKEALSWAIVEISNQEIDELGLTQATYLAYERCVSKLKNKPDYLLIDAYKLPNTYDLSSSTSIKKGDMVCTSIAAASIIAKDYRDDLMKKLAKKYPNYRFDLHKGYGTKLHQEMLKKYGSCKIHRRLFAPIRLIT